MKRLFNNILIMFSLFTFGQAFALSNKVIDMGNLKNKLIEDIKVASQTSSLYSLVKQEFENYYGLKEGTILCIAITETS